MKLRPSYWSDLWHHKCQKYVDIIMTIPYAMHMAKRGVALELKQKIADRIRSDYGIVVWTPLDFLDLGPRAAVDQALRRLFADGITRRIDRGLYDIPRPNRLTGRPTTPDYRAIIDAVARRDQIRVLVDGLTAANDLGLTDAVPARVVVHTDARLRPIKLDNLTITFKPTAPSRLYWAGRPAMRVVQALHWVHDMIPTRRENILRSIKRVLHDPKHGSAIREDLRKGATTLPIWMQPIVRDLIGNHVAQSHHQSSRDKPHSLTA